MIIPSWGTLAAIIAVAAGLGGFAIWSYHAIDDISTDAEVDDKIAIVKRDTARNAAWTMVQLKKMETLVLRNRINDCDAADKQTRLEHDACQQYRTEYEAAKAAYESAQKDALALSRPIEGKAKR